MEFLDPILTGELLGKPTWMWLSFFGIVVLLLAIDLGVLHKKPREIALGEILFSAYAFAAAMVKRIHYLKCALAAVLIFIGSKIFIADLLGIEKLPPALALVITFGLLTTDVIYSLAKTSSNAGAVASTRHQSDMQS